MPPFDFFMETFIYSAMTSMPHLSMKKSKGGMPYPAVSSFRIRSACSVPGPKKKKKCGPPNGGERHRVFP